MPRTIRSKPQCPPSMVDASLNAANENRPSESVHFNGAPTKAERAAMTGAGVVSIAGSGLLSATAINGGGALLAITSVMGVPNVGLWVAVGATGVALPVAGIALGVTLLRQAFKKAQ
ncbi:MAG: hypothetical protein VYC39_16085 [Myxococcota bacterium]|nr:hypothetical protein [Myxococcota bacterium]